MKHKENPENKYLLHMLKDPEELTFPILGGWGNITVLNSDMK